MLIGDLVRACGGGGGHRVAIAQTTLVVLTEGVHTAGTNHHNTCRTLMQYVQHLRTVVDGGVDQGRAVCVSTRTEHTGGPTVGVLVVVTAHVDVVALVHHPGTDGSHEELLDLAAVAKASFRKGCYVGIRITHVIAVPILPSTNKYLMRLCQEATLHMIRGIYAFDYFGVGNCTRNIHKCTSIGSSAVSNRTSTILPRIIQLVVSRKDKRVTPGLTEIGNHFVCSEMCYCV